jgi:hypothetical protein
VVVDEAGNRDLRTSALLHDGYSAWAICARRRAE